MATPQPIPIASTPGIKRDSTEFEGDNYTNGQWCRFTARGLPKKIAGYRTTTQHLDEIVRGMDAYAIDKVNYLHLGSSSELTQVQVGFDGSLGAQGFRTPASFAASPANLWQFGQMQNKVTGRTVLIAHAAQSLNDIASSIETPIYYGNVDDPSVLVASGMDPVSGGILAIAPYVLAFSNGGRVDTSVANDPTAATANSTFATAQKIVKGLPLRGQNLSAVLWSLDSVLTATFDPAATVAAGGITTFAFNTVSGESSILSEQGVLEFDSIYYWVGVDRFLLYNGIVQELPNDLNIDFFFDNLNFAQRQKVFAFKVPRWGEIWWCFPFGSAVECNHAVIYNTRLHTWYDTPLPNGGRSAGVFAKVYQRPFMADVDPTSTGFTLWQHETGVDKVVGSSTLPIQSFYRTREFSPLLGEKAVDKEFRVGIVEPDFKQSGDLTCTVFSRANARTDANAVGQVVIPEVAANADTQLVDVKSNARLLSFQFESNEPGGDYSAGRILAHIETTGGRMTQ